MLNITFTTKIFYHAEFFYCFPHGKSPLADYTMFCYGSVIIGEIAVERCPSDLTVQTACDTMKLKGGRLL